MSDVIAKNELKNFDGYEFDSYEDIKLTNFIEEDVFQEKNLLVIK